MFGLLSSDRSLKSAVSSLVMNLKPRIPRHRAVHQSDDTGRIFRNVGVITTDQTPSWGVTVNSTDWHDPLVCQCWYPGASSLHRKPRQSRRKAVQEKINENILTEQFFPVPTRKKIIGNCIAGTTEGVHITLEALLTLRGECLKLRGSVLKAVDLVNDTAEQRRYLGAKNIQD